MGLSEAAGPASLHRGLHAATARIESNESLIAHLSHASQELSSKIMSREAVSSLFVLKDKFADAIHHVVSAFESKYDDKVARMIAAALTRIFPAGVPQQA